jgi:hypothetical protein
MKEKLKAAMIILQNSTYGTMGKGCDEELKQETLEEAAERLFPFTKDDSENRIITIKRLYWIEGAKWQDEQNSWKLVSEETPPSNIELLVQNPNGTVHLAHWRESYDIFTCQVKSENSSDWKWKTI